MAPAPSCPTGHPPLGGPLATSSCAAMHQWRAWTCWPRASPVPTASGASLALRSGASSSAFPPFSSGELLAVDLKGCLLTSGTSSVLHLTPQQSAAPQDSSSGGLLALTWHLDAPALCQTESSAGLCEHLTAAGCPVHTVCLLAPACLHCCTCFLRAMLTCQHFICRWPIGVGIMAGIGTDLPKHEYGFNHYPEPQVAKLIYGGTMSALETAAPLVLG